MSGPEGETPLPLDSPMRWMYQQQYIQHEPIAGRCPICGVPRCTPRADARRLLIQAGLDVGQLKRRKP